MATLKKLQADVQVREKEYEAETLAAKKKHEQNLAPILKQRKEAFLQAPIPGFWYKVLGRCPAIAQFLEAQDAGALQKLEDVSHVYNDDGMESMTLTFTFADNEWFKNRELTVTFTMQHNNDSENYIGSMEASHIEWNEGKNLTSKKVPKKKKNEDGSKVVIGEVERPVPSFFGMFKSRVRNGEREEGDEDTDLMESYHEAARILADDYLPNALSTWAKEEAEDDAFPGGFPFDDDDEDEDDDDDDDDDVAQGKRKQDCQLVWEGVVKERGFRAWKVLNAKSENEIRAALSDVKAEHYWDMIKRFRGAEQDL